MNILILVFLVSCSEESECVEPTDNGTASMVMNDRLFELGVIAGDAGCNNGNLSIALGYSDEKTGSRLINFGLANFPAQNGTYKLKRRETLENECELMLTYASLATLDHDALIEIFGIVEEADNNELIITHYDSAAARLEGRFSMTLAVKDLFRVDSIEFPDTLVIEYGTFSTEVLPPRE